MDGSETKREYLRYALRDGRLVSIDNVPNGNECGCQCPACGKELCARNNGTKRIHHFAHQSGADCPGAVESSIHLLAKKVLKERFDDANKPFLIQFVRECKCCDYETCQYADDYRCKETRPIGPYNLKDYYDTCSVEVKEGDFRPDLLLTSSKRQVQPIYFEVFYKHKCEEGKLASGKKIIEIKVNNEEEVLALGTMDVFMEKGEKQSFPQFFFHSFYPKTKTQETIVSEINYSRFIYFNNGSAYCNNSEIVLCCDKANERERNNSLIELNIEKSYFYPTTYHLGLVYLLDKGYDVKNCCLCKYYKESMYDFSNYCALYKKFQTPINPSSKEAIHCRYFSIDQRILKDARECIKDQNKIIELK